MASLPRNPVPRPATMAFFLLLTLVLLCASCSDGHRKKKEMRITTDSLPNATIGQSYSEVLVAAGGKKPYTWSLTNGSLPSGLTLDPAGQILGTPDVTAQNSSFTVQATDSRKRRAPREATTDLTIFVNVMITPAFLPAGVLGEPYVADVDALGGDGTYSFSVDPANPLPPGLTINAMTGEITGTLTTTGSYLVEVVAQSNPSLEGRHAYLLEIGTLSISPQTLPNASIGQTYGQTLTASGGLPPYTYALESGSLPDGLSLVGDTITGTPLLSAINSTFTVRATDADTPTQMGLQTYELLVEVEILTTSLPDGMAGYPYSAPLAAAGGDGLTYTWSLVSGALPCGLSLISTPGEIAGRPCCEGAPSFVLQVASSPPTLTASHDYASFFTVSPWTSIGDENEGADFGFSLASAGDVNGDGFGDLIVGADDYADVPGEETGKAYVFLGSPDGLSPTPDWSATGSNQRAPQFGHAVDGAGDVNGDGFDDIIVGEFGHEASGTWGVGRAVVYHGGPSGLEATPTWTAIGESLRNEHFGSRVAGAGDVNGDGFDDVIVGADNYIGPGLRTGRAYVFLGGQGGLDVAYSWSSVGDGRDNAGFGVSVDGAGDVNRDGFDEVIVGAHEFVAPSPNPGKAFVFHGGPAGPSLSADWTSIGDNQDSAQFGEAVAGVGDVNGDGFDDIAIGACEYDAATQEEGRTYVFHGGPGGVASVPAWTSEGDSQPGASFGNYLAGAGDTNGDGFADLIVSAPAFTTTQDKAGKAYVFRGGPTGLESAASWTSTGDDQAGAFFGAGVATAGRINGSVADQVAVGAAGFDTILPMVGKVYVFCFEP